MDDVELPYHAFFGTMPESHRGFFRGLKLFHRSGGAVFVHAGVDPDGGAFEEQNTRELTWGLFHNFPKGPRGPQRVVYGHRNNCVIDASGWPQPRIVNELTFGIDSVSTGVLTAIRMRTAQFSKARDFAEGFNLQARNVVVFLHSLCALGFRAFPKSSSDWCPQR